MNYPQEKSAPAGQGRDATTQMHKRVGSKLPGDSAFDKAEPALQFVWLVQYVSKERRMASGGGYKFNPVETPTRSVAFIRWEQGRHEETAALVDYEAEHVLFTEDQHDSHERIAEAAVAVGWDVHVVDHLLVPTCPSCGGACFIRDCGINERCELCEGEGVLR